MRRFLSALPALLLLSQVSFASVDSGLLAMVPPESTLLTGIDVSRVAGSRFGSYLLGQMHSDEDFAKFSALVGFDPRHDVQAILMAGLGRQTAGDSRFAIIARGTFDAARISSAAQSKGAATAQYHGFTILVQDQGKRSIGIAFPEAGVVIVGDLATVHTVLESAGAATNIDPKLTEQVNRIGSNNDIWFATLLSGNFLGRQLGSAAPQLQGSDALQSILQSSGGVQFGDTVTVSLDLTARSPEDARSVSDLLHFAGNLVQMHSGGDSRGTFAANALNTMQVTTDGPLVEATLAVPEAQLEQLVQQQHSH